jgi:hypothetical protein
MTAKTAWESFKVQGGELLERVKEIIAAGNARSIVIKQGSRRIVEFPLTIGVVGAVLAPVLAAVGALAAVLSECTIEVERIVPEGKSNGAARPRKSTRTRTRRR